MAFVLTDRRLSPFRWAFNVILIVCVVTTVFTWISMGNVTLIIVPDEPFNLNDFLQNQQIPGDDDCMSVSPRLSKLLIIYFLKIASI